MTNWEAVPQVTVRDAMVLAHYQGVADVKRSILDRLDDMVSSPSSGTYLDGISAAIQVVKEAQ